ncbi:transporter substrate-binding domain-containing protein, partial [Myxococcota bacterium]|nr:transporter substrate-binding domain-containing protein [Myxococcota bacterium]
NEGLAQVIADGTFNRLRSKWFASLDLPSAERIVVGGDYNYPPYEFLDKKGQPTGYNIELTQALARVTGLDIEIRLGPWADIVEQMKSGEIDVIQGMFYSPERDKLFEFSPPHTVIHHVAVVRKNTLPPAQIADLMGKRIVVMKGDIMHDWLLEKGINTQITTVETQADALRELASGKHDCALVARLPAMYLIEKYGLDNLILAEHSLLAPEYGYAVPHQRKVLLARLSEGLNILHRSGEYQRIYVKWMGVYESSTPDVFTIPRYVAMVVMPLLLILLAMLIWSRMLRKEVALRTQALIEANQIIDRSPAVAFLWKSVEGWPVEFVSANVEKLTGYTTGDFVEAKVAYSEIIHPDDLKRVAAEVIDYCKEGSLLSFAHEPYRIITQSGATKWVDDKSYIRRDAENCITHLEGIVQDITEDINRQAQLIQSQKMESVGRLAGGVAHDFNNMLAVIIGNVAMALEEVSPKSPPYEELEEIRKAAERSADLIRQLLAFARKQVIAPRVLQLNKTVDGMLKMLRRLIGEDIDLVWQPGA